MKKLSSIQKPVAFLLLLVFSLSAAPRAFFHDLLANHKDGPSCHKQHTSVALHTQSYQCHFDELVVSTPYLVGTEAFEALHPYFPPSHPESSFFSRPICFSFTAEGRGPPMA